MKRGRLAGYSAWPSKKKNCALAFPRDVPETRTLGGSLVKQKIDSKKGRHSRWECSHLNAADSCLCTYIADNAADSGVKTGGSERVNCSQVIVLGRGTIRLAFRHQLILGSFCGRRGGIHDRHGGFGLCR